MNEGAARVLWIGFRTLESLQEGCLGQKGVTLTKRESFEDGLAELERRPHDVLILSLSADGDRLRRQIAEARARAPHAFIAAIVCYAADVGGAVRAGADDVMSLEREGDLPCAPVLRWVEMYRAKVGQLIDLRATARAQRERDQLRAEVATLSRKQLHDPCSGALSREAFISQLELAVALLARAGMTLDLLAFELPPLPLADSDDVIGGYMSQVARSLSELESGRATVGRIGDHRFAVFVSDVSESRAAWLCAVAAERLGRICVPHVGKLSVSAVSGRIDCAEVAVPARLVLDELERQLTEEDHVTTIRPRGEARRA